MSWKRSASFVGSLAMLASNVRYGEPSAFGIRLRVEQNAQPQPRHMRSCNVRVLPNPRVTLWFRCGCDAPSARHRFNIEEKCRGAVARALAPVGAPLLVESRNIEDGRQSLSSRPRTAADSLDLIFYCWCAGEPSPRHPSPRHHAEFLGGVLKQHLNLIKTISIDVA